MKRIIAVCLTVVLLLMGLPTIHAETAAHADLSVIFKPTENTNGNVVLEIDMTVNNGESGQYISMLEFRYENTLIASVDALAARSNSFARSNPLNFSLTAMTSDLEIEVSYIDFNGDQVYRTLTASYQAAAPKLTFTRTASGTSAAVGDKIRLTYMLKNEGNVLLTDLQLYDDMNGIGLIDTVDMLYPGEMREFTVDVKMNKDVKSQPRVSYKAANTTQGMVMVLEALDLIIYNPKLAVTLKSDVAAVQAGDSVTLVCNVVNEGNVPFSNVTITDKSLGTIIESTKIDVGKAYSWNKLIKPVNSQNYMYTVTAIDANGQTYTATSNIVAVEVSDAEQGSDAAGLEVSVAPNVDQLAQPGEVTFNVLLRNSGANVISNLTISDQNANVLERINSLSAGDKIYPIAVNVTETGEYFFVVDGTLANGEKVQRISTPVTISVGLVQKTEQPTTDAAGLATPTPTPITINKDGGGISPWLLMLLIVIALLIIACVVVLVWIQLRANRRKNEDADMDDLPQQNYARPRPTPPTEDVFDYREEISRVATEYSKPVQQPPVRKPERQLSHNDLFDDEEDIQTVYKAKKTVEPRTKRND